MAPPSERRPPRGSASGSPGPGQGDTGDDRRTGPLEALFAEAVRRAASLGLSSFVLTEEALRRAFNDSVPRDWIEALNRQGEEARAELFERLAKEFGQWLRRVDAAELIGDFLRRNELRLRIEVAPRQDQEDGGVSLRVVPREK